MSAQYIEMTRRASDFNFDETFDAIDDLENKKNHLLEALNVPIWWEEKPFATDEYPLIALYALKLGEISQNHCADLALFYAKKLEVVEGVEEKTVALPFKTAHGKINPLAVEVIFQQARATKMEINREKVEQVIQKIIQTQPPIEQQIFLVPNHFKDTDTISERLSEIAYGLFTYVRESWIQPESEADEYQYRMIPSISFAKTFFVELFGEDKTITPNPVFGPSSIKDILKNGEMGTRDVAIPFPGINLPEEADGLNAPGFDFTYHDLYHTFVATNIGKKVCQAFIEVAKIFRAVAKKQASKKEKALLYGIAWILTDMEHEVFLPDERIKYSTVSHIFWDAVDKSIEYKIANSVKNRNSIPQFRKQLASTGVFKELFGNYNEEKKKWVEEYGIELQPAFILVFK